MKLKEIIINHNFTKFKNNQSLMLDNTKSNVTFIYGVNGTGKSSISRLFYYSNLKLNSQEESNDKIEQLTTIGTTKDANVKIVFDDNSETIISNKDIINPHKIPTFNKDYIDDKITYQQNFRNNKFDPKNSTYSITSEAKINYINKKKEYDSIIEQGKNIKTEILKDDNKFGSNYLEKLKEIYKIYYENNISCNQKLYIHNYCRYIIETLSRFEFPNHNSDSDSSRYYIDKLLKKISEGKTKYGISENSIRSVCNIINKGSHATIDIVHDDEEYDDSDYINCCKVIINYLKVAYNGQYDYLSTSYHNALIAKKDEKTLASTKEEKELVEV